MAILFLRASHSWLSAQKLHTLTCLSWALSLVSLCFCDSQSSLRTFCFAWSYTGRPSVAWQARLICVSFRQAIESSLYFRVPSGPLAALAEVACDADRTLTSKKLACSCPSWARLLHTVHSASRTLSCASSSTDFRIVFCALLSANVQLGKSGLLRQWWSTGEPRPLNHAHSPVLSAKILTNYVRHLSGWSCLSRSTRGCTCFEVKRSAQPLYR